MLRISILLLSSLLFFACKNTPGATSQSSDVSVVSEDVPQDFLGFYMQFHSDTIFQKEHIIFPLSQQADGSPWLREGWTIHKAFTNQDGFKQVFTSVKGLVFETIKDDKGLYTIERRFSKSADSYNLIYYKITNGFGEGWEAK